MSAIPTFSTDVLVVGAGNAALCAAITAAEHGARVICTELAHYDMRGGNSRHTRNLRCMHEAPTDVLEDAYPLDEYFDDLLRVTEGHTDESLARMTLERSAGLTDWMQSQGVRFQNALGGTLSLSRTNAFFLGGGKALVNTYAARAEALGVRILYDTEVLELDIEGLRFTAARVLHRGQPTKIQARAVVVAAGGFEANLDWLKQAWGSAAENFLVRGTPYNRGVLLRDLLDKGAMQIGRPDQCHAVAIDARAPQYDGGIVTRLDCVPYGVVVNRDAQRFYDEGEDVWPKRYAIWGRLVAGQPGQIAYVILDAKSRGLFMPPVFPPVQAGSIEALATELKLDPAALQATLDAYNAAVRPGRFEPQALDDCRTEKLIPPKTHWARAIDTPPYLAYPLRPGITFTYLGVAVDDQARVRFGDGEPAKNLYAAGEIMAGNILGKGYLAGLGMTIGTVFGRIAGERAVRGTV